MCLEATILDSAGGYLLLERYVQLMIDPIVNDNVDHMVLEQGHDIYRVLYTIPKIAPIWLIHLREME